MDITNNFDNYEFITLENLNISPDTKIVILYARFMHNSQINWTMDTHSHSFYELHLPLNGNCNIVLQNSKQATLNTGEVLLIHPNTNHKFTHFSDKFFRLSVAFNIQRNNKIPENDDNYITEKSNGKIARYLDRILFEHNNQNLGYKSIAKFQIQSIIIEFLRLHPELLCIEETPENAARNILNEALGFIKSNISSDIVTEHVAKHVNLGSRQLNRIFGLNLNMTISEFIRNERILQVREHLEKTNLPLAEIASLTGFNDEYVLCKTFKKITGTTPGKYRQTYKKKGSS